jgi:hypothetical protein
MQQVKKGAKKVRKEERWKITSLVSSFRCYFVCLCPKNIAVYLTAVIHGPERVVAKSEASDWFRNMNINMILMKEKLRATVLLLSFLSIEFSGHFLTFNMLSPVTLHK